MDGHAVLPQSLNKFCYGDAGRQSTSAPLTQRPALETMESFFFKSRITRNKPLFLCGWAAHPHRAHSHGPKTTDEAGGMALRAIFLHMAGGSPKVPLVIGSLLLASSEVFCSRHRPILP